jgi:methylated-DNA-[protein]-cysteine S-methyltransferase
MYYSTSYPSPVGTITLACNENGLVGLWIEKQKYHGGTISSTMTEKNNVSVFNLTKKWLDRYFAKRKPAVFELPLAPIGGTFRQDVWAILCEIPYGEVITYGDIAKKLAKKMNKNSMSSQAVGGAVGHNPIAIIIPCHRVIGANGNLTGYAGGISRKVKLLELEGVDMSRLFVPTKGTAL